MEYGRERAKSDDEGEGQWWGVGGLPRAHLPVRSRRIGVDADGLDAVVELLWAVGHDAALVRLPLVRVDTDGERAARRNVPSHRGLSVLAVVDGVVGLDGDHRIGRLLLEHLPVDPDSCDTSG